MYTARPSTPPGNQMTWKLQQARVSVFFKGESSILDSEAVFSTIFSTPPETTEKRSREGIELSRGLVEFGGASDVMAVCQVSFERLDAVVVSEAGPGDAGRIGAANSIWPGLVAEVADWASEAGLSIFRVAVGPTIDHSAASSDAAANKLATRVPIVNLGDTPPLDLMVQLNYRRESDSNPGCTINRLGKWSVVATSSIEFRVDEAGVGVPLRQGGAVFRARGEIDVNSVPLSEGKLDDPRAMLNECAALALEMIEGGSRP